RTPTVFGLVFWALLALWPQRRRNGGRPGIRPLLRFAAPLAIAVALLLGQNLVRFGRPLDFGYLTMRVARELAPDLRRHGQFNAAYLPRNLRALLVAPPIVTPAELPAWRDLLADPAGLLRQLRRGERPTPAVASGRNVAFSVRFDPWGTGVWAVSPALVVCLRPPRRRDVRLWLACWASAACVALPNLLYYNTGWYQYGYRFALDFLPFLIVLAALGMRRPFSLLAQVLLGLLLLVSMASNVLGARWFLRLPPY
ncbi:MAG: hypothetical protein ACRDJN_12865, partial [Chloroflexota bacterium]